MNLHNRTYIVVAINLFTHHCRENRVTVVEYLLKNPDVYPSQRDATGQTPLHWACKWVTKSNSNLSRQLSSIKFTCWGSSSAVSTTDFKGEPNTVLYPTNSSLVPGPSHVFNMRERRPDRSGDVIDTVWGAVMCLHPLAHAVSHIVKPWLCTLRGWVGGDTNHISNYIQLHRQVNDAFLIFLAYVENHGKACVCGPTNIIELRHCHVQGWGKDSKSGWGGGVQSWGILTAIFRPIWYLQAL